MVSELASEKSGAFLFNVIERLLTSVLLRVLWSSIYAKLK